MRLAGQVWVAEAPLVLGLGALALAVRLPSYQLVPAFTDEMADIYRSVLTAQGKLLPLTDTSTYVGSLWEWLMAAALLLSGFNLAAPRALALAFGVLTVLATYLLGRAWGGRAGGLVAAALLGTSSMHIVVNSHVAWSNCITPLFTTLAIWMSYLALRLKSQVSSLKSAHGMLLLSGLFWGLALQTHPTVLALLPGAAIFFWRGGKGLLRTRWFYIAAGLAVLANLNLVAYNLLTGFDSLSFGARIATGYARREELTPLAYLGRLEWILVALLQSLGGAVDRRESVGDFLSDVGLWPIALLGGAAIVGQWRRGNPLPGLLLLSMILVLPLGYGRVGPWVPWPITMLNLRYLAPLLPVIFAAVGTLVAEGLQLRQVGALPASPRRAYKMPALPVLGLGLIVAFVVAHPVLYLRTYYEQAARLGRTNEHYLEVIELIKTHRRVDEVVIIDQLLESRNLGAGSAWSGSVFRTALAVEHVPYQVSDVRSGESIGSATRCRGALLLASRQPEIGEDVAARLELRGLDDRRGGATRMGRYALYHLDRQPGVC